LEKDQGDCDCDIKHKTPRTEHQASNIMPRGNGLGHGTSGEGHDYDILYRYGASIYPDVITISCHCHYISYASDTIRFPFNSSDEKLAIDLDHSVLARKYSGQMFTSYYPMFRPPMDVLRRLTAWETMRQDSLTVFFCPRCGCHMFSRTHWILRGHPLRPLDPDLSQQVWGVATGTVRCPPYLEAFFSIGRHKHVSETGDGGLAVVLRHRKDGSQIGSDLPRGGPRMPGMQYAGPPVILDAFAPPPQLAGPDDDVLRARCACGRVSFYVTRPNQQSLVPHSDFPDLMMPYHSWTSRIHNAEDTKWWIRPPAGKDTQGEVQSGEGEEAREQSGKKRYLAGTCACTSCRLTSGFEIQSWAFIPRANIFIHSNPRPADLEGPSNYSLFPVSHYIAPQMDPPAPAVPLDFANLPPRVLRGYRSSKGVRRDFCGCCGATVFWHNERRPELIDVSVGLFEGETARAGKWFDWWTERVSFEEDRVGGRERHRRGGWDVVGALVRGLGVEGEEEDREFGEGEWESWEWANGGMNRGRNPGSNRGTNGN